MSIGSYDVVVIGSGAGGGSLLQRLAPTGKRILVLERGDFLPREKRNWDVEAVALGGCYDAGERWRDAAGRAFAPGVKYVVGGNTKVWGAAMLRMRPSDFGAVRHAGGTSPAWPISYAELEPYYTEAEQLWRVRGLRGADPTEGPASAPYAHAPVRHEPRVERLVRDFARAGARAWPLPLAIARDDGDPRSACIRCDTCDGFPCLVRGKSDAETICVLPALAHPNVTLLTGARALRLETDARGRSVTGVAFERGGALEFARGDVVVVACGAVNSAALLLRSANARWPHGLANGSDLVGRHYMCHQNSAVFALSRHENHSVLQKTFGISDWYHASDDWELPMGLVQPLNRTSALQLAAQPPGIDGYSAEYLATHSLEFWLTSEDLPARDNRVRLDRDGRIVLAYAPNNVEAHARLTRRLATLLADVEGDGFDPDKHYRATRMPIEVCSHQCGTLRFGEGAATSVLDRDCRAHGLDNLYAVDASCFPSSAAVNPTLTIVANALRVADRLKERLG
ncbi:MAG: dehydrogenase [Proteobacteria bacterium]|nr:MAG: dehydrogenase [Pseudomonadota bacterium]